MQLRVVLESVNSFDASVGGVGPTNLESLLNIRVNIRSYLHFQQKTVRFRRAPLTVPRATDLLSRVVFGSATFRGFSSDDVGWQAKQ